MYTLPDTSTDVLLTGDSDFVIEFAQRLTSANIPFRILAPLDGLDELDFEFDIVHPDVMRQTGSDADYGPFSEFVLDDLKSYEGTFTHVVELSVAPSLDRSPTLEIAASLYPGATIVVSALTTTVTEMGLLCNAAHRITGITLAPSIITTATTIDVAAGLNTDRRHLTRTIALFQALGYTPQEVEDRLALVQMRVLAMLINEAAFAVMEGVATPADIDTAMKLGVNYPNGLLSWADAIGIPVIVLVLESLYREYHQERYRPCVLLKQYMRAGWTGKAAGRGFYVY